MDMDLYDLMHRRNKPETDPAFCHVAGVQACISHECAAVSHNLPGTVASLRNPAVVIILLSAIKRCRGASYKLNVDADTLVQQNNTAHLMRSRLTLAATDEI